VYIIFEGIDTVGKTTQINLLKELYLECIITKEPGGTNFGKRVREILLNEKLKSKRAEVLLFLADRAEHYEEVIKPNLDKLIISDRGLISGIAYALATNLFKIDELISLNLFALENTLPDRVIFFKIDRDTLIARLNKKELDEIEARGIEYLLKVQNHIEETIKALNIPYIIIDASLDISSIHKEIAKYIELSINQPNSPYYKDN